MKKQHVKYIKEIANRLPVVYQKSVSGFYEDIAEDGSVNLKPNIFNGEINHVRRMRKAYESLGMDGIRQYLDMIHKMQIERNELVQNELKSKQQELRVDSVASGAESGSNIDSIKDQGAVQDSEVILGGGREKRKRATRKNKQPS